MKLKTIISILAGVAFVTTTGASIAKAQSLDQNAGPIEMGNSSSDTPPPKPKQLKVGRKAAEKYMGAHPVEAADDTQAASEPRAQGSDRRPAGENFLSSSEHYLAVDIGTFVSDNEYKWGAKDADSNVGRMMVGVTYRVGEWVHSMDLAVRVDYQTYALADGGASKLSFMPLITFPDSASKFPLYFGAGIGPGIFVTQVNKESPISLDYQVVMGARFFNIIDRTGFFVEAGLKNHFLLLSDGQFNGTFVSAGAVFSF